MERKEEIQEFEIFMNGLQSKMKVKEGAKGNPYLSDSEGSSGDFAFKHKGKKKKAKKKQLPPPKPAK